MKTETVDLTAGICGAGGILLTAASAAAAGSHPWLGIAGMAAGTLIAVISLVAALTLPREPPTPRRTTDAPELTDAENSWHTRLMSGTRNDWTDNLRDHVDRAQARAVAEWIAAQRGEHRR